MNNRWHTPALLLFLAINLAHVTEHVVQAIQIFVAVTLVPPATVVALTS